jgi:hypothetical protein
MSRNYAVLKKSRSDAVVGSGCYADLVRRLFQHPAVVAVVSQGATHNCEAIAAELAASGKRVIIVLVEMLLRMEQVSVPHQSDYVPAPIGNVWFWPAPDAPIALIQTRVPAAATEWLESLRVNFDAVLLDCPAQRAASGSSEIAATADCAVLAVEAGMTTKGQVRRDCKVLLSNGVKLVGSILIRRR